ncbi:MAG: peptidoglycan-associated lipoprotein Pal [Alphaproteobacteria bacterium]|nr:peptidoglycan-associated lipoprotein Pal [Alphaproteobacteria bacterium]
MSFKIISLIAATVLVAACATEPEDSGAASGQGSSSSASSSGSASNSVGSKQAMQNTQPNAPTPGSIEDLVVNVGDRVFFSFNKSDIQPDAADTLNRQAAWLKKFPNHMIVVEGHCDERGTREYNLALGERRANSVREYLISVGVAANRIATISYGKERPAVLGANDASWSQNRRGVTIVKNAGS